MNFGIIDPQLRTVKVINCKDAREAMLLAGLTPGKVDHGTIYRGLGIIVDEFGMYVPPDRQFYFAIDRRLYAGASVLFAFNTEGETIDYNFAGRWFGLWFSDHHEVEGAIKSGKITRPSFEVDGESIWTWPGPKPDLADAIQKLTKKYPDANILVDNDTLIVTEKTSTK